MADAHNSTPSTPDPEATDTVDEHMADDEQTNDRFIDRQFDVVPTTCW